MDRLKRTLKRLIGREGHPPPDPQYVTIEQFLADHPEFQPKVPSGLEVRMNVDRRVPPVTFPRCTKPGVSTWAHWRYMQGAWDEVEFRDVPSGIKTAEPTDVVASNHYAADKLGNCPWVTKLSGVFAN